MAAHFTGCGVGDVCAKRIPVKQLGRMWRTPFDTFGNDMYGYAKIDTRGRCHEN
ncbi:MAG: hypothetical protein JRG79_08050 [Deltaproteobacteria bacterium]|nr:hypothetical protein [Deltaproteobacteria bacterium]